MGGGVSNVAGGQASGVLSGQSNDACDADSAIVAGNSNGIGGGFSAEAFIGAGYNNAVMNAAYGFIGAGSANTVSFNDGFIGAGESNNNSGGDGAIVSGSGNSVSNTDGFVGAGSFNNISGANESGAYGAIVAGLQNSVSSQNGFIGAGYKNTITALSGLGGAYGVISGGFQNLLEGEFGVIGGGKNNALTGTYAVIGGGASNQAPGLYATVPGGFANYASGFASFAGGNNAVVVHPGAFVWSDAAGGTRLVSSASNQFLAKATGGVTFFSNPALTTGVALAPGSGTWGSVSDRAVKTNVVQIDDSTILDKVASLPISEWSYISEHGVHHVGPMAQDFYSAFGVGADNKHITSIDEGGVALAAIKALHSENRVLKAQLAKMESQVAHKDAAVGVMQRQLHQLSAAVALIRSR